jgi:hypothetical protein
MNKYSKLLPRFDYNVSDTNSLADKATSTGTNAINSFDPTQTAGSQQTKLGDSGLGGLLGGETTNYTNDYTNAVKSNPTVTSLYNTANNMFNVPGLAQTATNLQNRVTNLTPDAYRASRGYDIDATDINNGIANSSAYLTPQSNAATANYNTAAGLASNFVQAGQAQNQQNLLPIQARGTLLQQQEAAQATGWNNSAQSEFQGLMEKMNAGVQLSATEMQRANTLAQIEEAYQQNLTTQTASQNIAKIGQQFQTVPYASRLVNTMNGNVFS